MPPEEICMHTAFISDRARIGRKPAGFIPAFIFIIVLSAQSFPIRAAAGSLLWEARSSTSTVYLLGSIHYAKSDMYPLAAAIEDAFEKSSTLVLEFNPLTVDQGKLQQEILARGMYTGDKTIRDALSGEAMDMLKDYVERAGFPLSAVMKMKPAVLALTLNSLELLRLGYSPEQGIDMYFAKKAAGSKPILELESPEEQMEMLFGIPDPDLLLMYTIRDISKTGEQIDQITESWKTGDADRIHSFLFEENIHEHPGMTEILEEIVYRRNRTMAEKIKGCLSTGKTYFVVVGAAHLIGDRGIVELIEQAGYRVRKF